MIIRRILSLFSSDTSKTSHKKENEEFFSHLVHSAVDYKLASEEERLKGNHELVRSYHVRALSLLEVAINMKGIVEVSKCVSRSRYFPEARGLVLRSLLSSFLAKSQSAEVYGALVPISKT